MKKSTKLKLAVASVPVLTGLYALATIPGGLTLIVRPVKTVREMRRRPQRPSLFEQMNAASLGPDKLAEMRDAYASPGTFPVHSTNGLHKPDYDFVRHA